MGVDLNDPDFNEAGKTGGAVEHSHNLSQNSYAKIDVAASDPATLKYDRRNVDSYATYFTMTGGQGATMLQTNSTTSRAVTLGGTTDSESSLPPFITCYVWKRVA